MLYPVFSCQIVTKGNWKKQIEKMQHKIQPPNLSLLPAPSHQQTNGAAWGAMADSVANQKVIKKHWIF